MTRLRDNNLGDTGADSEANCENSVPISNDNSGMISIWVRIISEDHPR